MVNNYVMQIMHTLFSEIKGDFTWEEFISSDQIIIDC